MLVYGKIVFGYFRGVMLVTSHSVLGYLLIVGSARGSRTVVTRSYLGSTNVCKKSIYFEFLLLLNLKSIE